ELHASEQHDGVTIVWAYDRCLFARKQIEQLSMYFGRVLRSITDPVSSQLSTLEVLTKAERIQILRQSTTAGGKPPSGPAIEGFEQQDRTRRDAIAVVDNNCAVTYATLNTAADALAMALAKVGIGAEVVVGVSLDRSPLAFAAIL